MSFKDFGNQKVCDFFLIYFFISSLFLIHKLSLEGNDKTISLVYGGLLLRCFYFCSVPLSVFGILNYDYYYFIFFPASRFFQR